jgi:hypothetical protein
VHRLSDMVSPKQNKTRQHVVSTDDLEEEG